MATVYWPYLVKGYNERTLSFVDYGFDLRFLLVPDAAHPFLVNTNGTGFTALDKGPYGGGPVSGHYIGTFTLDRVSIADGTVNSLTRQMGGEFVGSVSELQVPFKDLSAAAETEDKSDDMALWAQAFAGNDAFTGSNAADRLEGFAGNDTMSGGVGYDFLEGGLGLDHLNGGAGDDSLYGGDDDDVLTGELGADRLYGELGLDYMNGDVGNDVLYGGGDSDTLFGHRGADKLYGGEGADSFAFTSSRDSTAKAAGRDTIYDFSSRQRDKIDLKAIDASTKAKGNQAFKYIGKQDFHDKAGELRWEKVKAGVYVYGDVNGDGNADFSLLLRGVTKLTNGDFFL
jgi:Ca2+-binding RTX toxin-like protein